MQIASRRLSELLPGESGRIRSLECRGEVRHRLLEMGLTAGTAVRVVRYAPLGRAVELDVRGYRLGVRNSEAASIIVEDCR